MAEAKKEVATAKAPAAAAAPEKPAKPETVALKEVAKRAGVEPREARSILRKIAARDEGEKRSRWEWLPADVATVVAKIKAAVVEKEKAKADKAEAAAEEEGD